MKIEDKGGKVNLYGWSILLLTGAFGQAILSFRSVGIILYSMHTIGFSHAESAYPLVSIFPSKLFTAAALTVL